MRTLVIATGNPHKARELRGLLPLRGVRWRSLADFPGVRPVREGGATFAQNAVRKALAVAEVTGELALADDSGLEVEALGWGPGVRSARFAGRHGADGANNRKLLRLLDGVPPPKRRARYHCVLALATPGRLLAVTHGTWPGRIAEAPAGQSGFGYDPLFLVPAFGRTVGQLSAVVKRRLSHRARAARCMAPKLRRALAAR